MVYLVLLILVIWALHRNHSLLLLENQHLLLHHVYLHLNSIWLHARSIHDRMRSIAIIERLERWILIGLTNFLNSWAQFVIAVLIKQVLVTVYSSLRPLTLGLGDSEVLSILISYKT